MLRNQHDTWQHFCNLHRELLVEAGLPSAVTHAEHRFRELLYAGESQCQGVSATLTDLDPARWSALERFAAIFFREFESYAPDDLFPAFHHEARRRGSSLFPG